MVRVFVGTVINASIDKVWAVVRAFDNVSWFPPVQVKPAPIEDGLRADTVGAVRQLTLPNGLLREKLLALDDKDHRVTYSILDGPLPVSGYVATMHLQPVTLNGTRTYFAWEANFTAVGASDDEVASIIGDNIFTPCLQALDKHMASLGRLPNGPRTTRLLHTMLRVGDLNKSIDFYTKTLGMKFLRTDDHPEGEYTLSFLGFGAEDVSTVLELTYNYGKTQYAHGESYGHICIAVAGGTMKTEVERLRGLGVTIDYESDDGFMAFVMDPDGYAVELLDEDLFAKHWSKSA